MKTIESYYPKYIKNTYKSIAKNPNNLIKRRAKPLNKHFSKEDIQLANMCMKR